MKVYRKPYRDSFTYKTDSGKTIKDKALKRWIESLAIPPAWSDVVINSDRSAQVYAYGRDSKDRKQYIYNPKWTEKSQKQKFNRIIRFAEQLETMRRATGQHLAERPIT